MWLSTAHCLGPRSLPAAEARVEEEGGKAQKAALLSATH